MTAIALTIAGSEASGGAGAQTDLKTFHTLGVYGCTALTCIVSMDPKDGWNHRFVPVDPGVIADQIETCGQEFGGALEVDNALRTKILPHATMTTPNLFEAATLAGMEEITTVEQLKDAAKRIHDQGVPNVLAKAGPSLGTGTALDVFYDGTTLEVLEVEAVGTERVHGAGCTLAAAVTAELAKGAAPLEAAVTAKEVVSSSIRHGLRGNMPFLYVYQGEYRQG